MTVENVVVRRRSLAVALDWLARVRVSGIEAMAAGLEITPRQARRHVAALEAERLLVRSRMADWSGSVAAITPRGVRWAGYPVYSNCTVRSLGGLLHGRGVSWIAAFCERRGRAWFGPEVVRHDWVLSLRRTPGNGPRTHTPDLAFILHGEERWAVEFERVPKARDRLREILNAYRQAQLAGQLHGALYVCGNEPTARLVQSTAEEVKVDRAVRTLDWVIAETTLS